MLMGFVNSSSSVPAFFSSLKLRIVTAGIRKIKIHGAIWKKGARSAKPLLGILKSPSKTHKNKLVTMRNNPMTRYPIAEEKNEAISFFSSAYNGWFF